MAAASAACIYSVGTRFLGPQRTMALAASQFLSSFSLSQLGFNHLRLRTTVPASRKLVVLAVRTESKGVSLGFRAADFEVMFICNHCPFVIHLKKDIVKLTKFYMKRGLAVVAICSNSISTHPQDGPQFMAEEAKLFNYAFPYLFDEDGRRPFHGQFDDARPSNNVPVTGRDLTLAIDCVLSGQPVSSAQKLRWVNLYHRRRNSVLDVA